MNNIKTFDEFVNTENIEEGKIKDFAKAAALATGLSVAAHLSDKPNEIQQDDVNKDTIEYVENMKEEENVLMLYPGKEYQPSEGILDYIKEAEGWHEGWKNDGKGNKTTGWGFKITKDLKKRFPKGMTKAQADKYFTDEAIPERVTDFIKSVPNIDKYTQGQLDALFDLFYNVGVTMFTEGSPNLQKGLENCNIKQIVKEMDHDYNDPDVPGARKRRDFERQMFVEYA